METIKQNLELGIVSFSGFDIKTKIDKGKEVKDVKFKTPWKEINKDNCLKQTTGLNVGVICGSISGISVLDFDNMDTYEQVVSDYPTLKYYKQVRTRNGVHVYGKYNKDLHTNTNSYGDLYPGIDIRNDGGMVFAPPTRYCLRDGTIVHYEDMGGDILEFPPDLIQKQKYIQKELLKMKKNVEKKQVKLQRKIDNEPITDLHEICRRLIGAGLLDDKCDEYDDWYKVGLAIYNSIRDFTLFDLFSQRSTKYDVDSVIKFWENIKERFENKLTFASIIYWAKEKDMDLYLSLNIDETKVREQDNELTFQLKSRLFELTHCKIIQEGLYIHEENHNIRVISENEIRNRYKHIQCGFTRMGTPINFIDRWLVNNNDIRNKSKMGIYMKDCPDDSYNLWTPFTMELVNTYVEKSNAIDLFKKHVSILCNHEEKIVDFVIKWIAFMLQYPEKKSKMLVFISDEGAGKNTLLEIIKKMIGDKKVFETTNPSRDVWGNFNGQMVDAFLVNLSEISALDFKNAMGIVKGLITDPTVTINEKMVKPFKIHSYHHFIVSTNNEESIKPSKNDRRNCLIRSSDELIKVNKSTEQVSEINKYLKEIYSMIEDSDSIKTIYEWLKNIPDLEDFFNVPFPMTEFHMTMTELSITPIEAWLRDFVATHHGQTEVEYPTGEVYDYFKVWIKSNIPNYECSSVQFAVRLTNFNKKFITMKKTKTCNHRIFNIPELHSLLFPNTSGLP
jgi:hypothetical protein